MLAYLEGYNKVEYSRNGEQRSFVAVFVRTNNVITYGSEYYRIILSSKYWEDKIYPAFTSSKEVHVGFDKQKGNKPFLYVK